jgi:uncharacterized protein
MNPSETVQRYLRAVQDTDFDAAMDCLAEDVVWRAQGAEEVPTVGVRHGKRAVREWLELIPRHFKPVDFKVGGKCPVAERVVLVGSVTHIVMDMGKTFASDFAVIFRVDDGKICEYSFLEDSYAL